MPTPTTTDTPIDDRWEADARITGGSFQRPSPAPCSASPMTRQQALNVAIGLLEEHAKCGQDECAEASGVLSKMLTRLIREKVKRQNDQAQLRSEAE